MKQPAVEKATPADLGAILEVMRPWNMHHVPSPEMEELDLECFYVARLDGRIVGAAGYKVLSQTRGKTTLLGVLPEYCNAGIGRMLQDARLEAMHRIGVNKVITNADRPETIAWYKRRYGYREVGRLAKVCSFGDPAVDYWTTLELDLDTYFRNLERTQSARDYVARNEPHPLAPYSPLVISACLTGLVPDKKMTALVPISVEEIVEDAVRVYDAGARVVHLHARNENGAPTWDARVYERIITGIRRERPQLVCCVSTSGRLWSEFERRSEVLYLTGPAKPELASLTLGSMNFSTAPSINSPEMIERLAMTMRERQIRPELEVFDLGMIGVAKYLERKGVISGRKCFNLLLGNLGTVPATIANLAALVAALPEDSFWAAAGLGVFQLPVNVAGLVAGGGVRVGIEDAVYYDYARKTPASNLDLVTRVVRIATELQRPVASPADTRRLLGLEPQT
ncbi:MAG: GNAT family N-acetyltransferase [Acidobacteriota bacterium]